MHAITYNYAPSSFANIWELNMNRNPEITLRNSQLYTLPNPRIELFKKSPLHSLPKTWNDLNETIRLQHNKTTFLIALKEYLLEQIILEQNT
jgi:hypothetical protein